MERIGVAPGTEIGGYRVLGPLGQGGMGAVYRAVDGDGVVVALKLLHPHLGADPDARERLRREVAHLQKVRHPAVARVLDAEIESTEAFLVTELVDGEDLATRVRTRGPLPPRELADLAADLSSALQVVHEAGVLHRDMTPGNVLVTDRGPVLIDFGIAQAVEDSRVTSTGLVVGTPGYLSPELLEGGAPSEAGDWWGWAALLAYAATGRAPFGGPPTPAVLARARSGEVDLAGLDRRTAAALRAALAVDPWRRATPESVVTELRRAAEGDTDPDGEVPLTTVLPHEPQTEVVASDGRTRTLPAGGPAAFTGPAADEATDDGYYGYDVPDGDGYDADDDTDDDRGYDDGYDDDADDVGGADGATAEDVEADVAPVPEPRRRVGTVLALGALLAAVGATRPGVALLLAVVAAVVVRSVGLDVAAVLTRRARRGAARADVARGVVGWPWYLLRALLGVLPAALVAASIVVVVGGVGWWLMDSGRLVLAAPAAGEPAGELDGNAVWVTPLLLAVAVVAGLLTVWFGPMSRSTRTGARWTLAAVAPGRAGAVTVTVLALAAAAALVTLVVLGQDTVWWPLPGPPDLR